MVCALQKNLGQNEFSPLGTSEPGLQVVSNVQQVDGGVAVPKNLPRMLSEKPNQSNRDILMACISICTLILCRVKHVLVTH